LASRGEKTLLGLVMVSKAGNRPVRGCSYQPISGSWVTISNRLDTIKAEGEGMYLHGKKYLVWAEESKMLLFCGNHAEW